MYQQLFEQTETLFKPIKTLFEVNQSALETLANQQAALLSDLVSDGINHVHRLVEEKNGNYLEIQRQYLETLNEKLTQAGQSTADYWAATQSKVADVLQETILGSSLVAATKHMPAIGAAAVVAAKPATTAKVVASKVPAAKPASAPKTAPVAAKPASKSPEAKTVEAKPAEKKSAPKSSTGVAAKKVVEEKAKSAVIAQPKDEASKKVGGDDASVEKAIRSIMSERTN